MSIVFRLSLFLLTVLQFLVKPIFWLIHRGKKEKVPPIKNDLLLLSATDLAAKIRKKELSSETVIKAYIERIKEVNPFINAVVEDRYEDAIQEARNIDMYLSKSSMGDEDIKKSKPLLGVPLTVKECCSLKDMELSLGHLPRKGMKAESDGKAVSRLRASGAIPLLISNTPELGLAYESMNYITGTTRNPYDTTRMSGGSSGGEGALLGAGASVIGIGSDLGGSIRIPAHFNGVFGHKPTAKVVPVQGHCLMLPDENFPFYLVVGPMARHAKDLRLMMNVISDPHLKSLLKLNEEVNFRKLNVYFMEEAGGYFLLPVQRDIKKAIRRAVDYLRETSGATVKNKKFPNFKYNMETVVPAILHLRGQPDPLKDQNGKGSTLLRIIQEYYNCLFGKSILTPFLLTTMLIIRLGTTLLGNDTKKRDELKQEFIESLGDNGILICPCFPMEAPRHHFTHFLPHSSVYLCLANVFGFPATVIPCGLNSNGLPIGIQVIAGPNQDRLCLAVAEQLEACFGGWTPP